MNCSTRWAARDNEKDKGGVGLASLTTASTRGLLILLVMVVGLGWANVAGADELPGPDTDDDTPSQVEQIVMDDRDGEPDRNELTSEQEQELTERIRAGIDAEEQQDYEQAREHFVRAYEIHPHSNLLLSVVRTSDHLGESRTTRTGYQTFLKRQPDYENREGIEDRITALEQQIEQQEKQQEKQQEEKRRAEMSLWPSEVGWAGAGAVLTGGISLIAAGVISSSVDNDFQQLDAAVAAGEREDALVQARDIGRRQAWGRFWLYGGVLMVTAGAGLVAMDMLMLDRAPWMPLGLGDSDGSTDGAGASVSVGEQGVMLQFSGSF